MKSVWISCAALAVLYTTMAATQTARPGPGEPGAKAPAVEYRSVFENYQPFKEQDLTNWRGANDEVRDAAGHKGHALGQGSGENAPPKPPAGQPQKAPATKGHEGHK